MDIEIGVSTSNLTLSNTKRGTDLAGRIKALLLRPKNDCFGDASAGSCSCRNRRCRNKKLFIFCFLLRRSGALLLQQPQQPCRSAAAAIEERQSAAMKCFLYCSTFSTAARRNRRGRSRRGMALFSSIATLFYCCALGAIEKKRRN